MQRRKFLAVMTLGVIGAMSLLFSLSSYKRKTKGILKSALHFLRPDFDLPEEGESISVETVLNSRCTSDHDGNPESFHWGMFDRTKKLTTQQIQNIISLAKIPRFTDRKVEIRSKRNILTFIVENHAAGIMRDWMMVESGMQQQAVGLVSASMGIGMVFRNLGKDGTSISDTDYGTIKIKLNPMKPSYNGTFWSNLPPAGVTPWLTGNLPDPVRDGPKPLISILSNLEIKNKGSSSATDGSISQLLWAARGRTPHLYKSRPWGMTIPTWAGNPHISSVCLISDNKVQKYANWDNNRPTHALLTLNKIESRSYEKLLKSFSANRALIVIGENESFARALWEVGYQLLNLLLQANSLDIPYQAVLLNKAQKSTVSLAGIKDPVAIFAI